MCVTCSGQSATQNSEPSTPSGKMGAHVGKPVPCREILGEVVLRWISLLWVLNAAFSAIEDEPRVLLTLKALDHSTDHVLDVPAVPGRGLTPLHSSLL